VNSIFYYIRSFFVSQQEIIEHMGTWEGIKCFVKFVLSIYGVYSMAYYV
jgi:hypothetical protein